MSWYKNLYETYNKIVFSAELTNGINKPLVPIYFILKNAKIKVVINEKSEFVNGEIINETIIIPSREEAEARTGSAEAFPLCDQLEFVAGINQNHLDQAKILNKDIKYDCNYFENYKKQLEEFYKKSLNENLKILLTYINKNILIDDLIINDIIKIEDICEEPKNNKGKYLGYIVRFVIQKNGENINLDEDLSIKQAWIDICSQSCVEDLCYDSGKIETYLKNYPKIRGGAKLISSNDNKNFVFRGRFHYRKRSIFS